MRRRTAAFVLSARMLLAAACIFLLITPAAARERPVTSTELEAISRTFVEIAEQVTPAVVGISTVSVVSEGGETPFFSDPYFRWFFGDRTPHPRDHEEEGLGSGVLVSPDGLILTNAHVVDGADHIRVTLVDRRAFKATVVGVDKKTDLAVLRIDGENLPWAQFGDSSGLRAGEVVLAIGNPFGLSRTVTMGIVSAVGRQAVGITDYEDFIQTDAAINPGNSGGAMVNTRGELIGINTAIFTQSGGYEGIGFAIPADLARNVMKSLVEKGRVVRGWLGVSIQEVTAELADQFGLDSPRGALVTDVFKDSPAERAGVMRGDVILSVGGKEISKLTELRLLVAATEVGSKVELQVQRDGRVKRMHVVLGEFPEESATAKAQPGKPEPRFDNVFGGIEAADLDRELARRFQVEAKGSGVMVVDVDPGSAASRAGLIPGDMILEIDRQEVTGMADYRRIAGKVGPKQRVLVLISRRGQTLFVGIEP
ncbi:MAG: DegQ family serine endoprotease [Nitrospirota bacterium]|nr:DegQ family serine endoprotease [Nitrospirota bacterium]